MGSHVCRYESSFLPLPMFGESEMDLPNAVRLPLYVLGLGWVFLGIAIISDVFMAAIEKVTSLKKRIKDKRTGRTITMHVWNATVANLTLMALGSSAPEILLSIIEIVGNDMFLGDLGNGTIVGSAAFNLLIISAVCVLSIDDGQIRKIKDVHVYAITATCSVFAYLWLIIVLMAPPSPNVVEIWEAIVTLLFFPLLVFLAYLADRGHFSKKDADGQSEKQMLQVIPENVTKDELAMIEQQIREEHGANITPDQLISIMSSKYFTPRSRAYYRHAAMQQTLGMKKVDVREAPETAVVPVVDTSDDLEQDRKQVIIGFASCRYAFLENCGRATIVLKRQGSMKETASVNYKTRDGTALAGQDYETSEGTIIFEPQESSKALFIKIHDDNAYEENEEFYVDLSNPKCEIDAAETNNPVPNEPKHVSSSSSSSSRSGSSRPVHAVLSANSMVTIVIIDDDEPGVVRFVKEEMTVEEGMEELLAHVVVERLQGASGTIGCRYYTEDMDGCAGLDYKEAAGQIELGPAVQSFSIPVTILPKGRYDNAASFNVILADPVGCKFDAESDGGAESCICHVVIKGAQNTERQTIIKRMQSKVLTRNATLGHLHWREQFYSAVFVVVEDDDDEDGESGGATKFDWFIHIISIPWKLLFACVPPPEFLNGWASFVGALMMIAVVTAFVGDMANLVGCVLNINPEITAITFVALGTSLPDTFASKTAACLDPYADASIGNITGSNSVNVFLGLGMSWSMAAFYWQTQSPTQAWLDKVEKPGGTYYDIRDDVKKAMSGGNAVFVVPAGSIWFNLVVFCINAFFAIQHLFARRQKFGGELGGPKRGFMGQYFSAGFLFLQWLIYITASSIYATLNE